ncbi:hypothetical protein BHE74_00044190, partial [Ensete ventricosum]
GKEEEEIEEKNKEGRKGAAPLFPAVKTEEVLCDGKEREEEEEKKEVAAVVAAPLFPAEEKKKSKKKRKEEEEDEKKKEEKGGQRGRRLQLGLWLGEKKE